MLFRFIAGNKLEHALNIGRNMIKTGKTPIINYINENVSFDNKGKIFQEYNNLINHVDNNYNIALKLSSLNFNKFLAFEIADKCKQNNIKLFIDAEDDKNITNYRNIINYMIKKYNSDNVNIIKTYQMYRKDSMDELYDDIKYFSHANTKLGVKLVRGAYFNSEYNDGHLFTNKKSTDTNYNNGIISCFNNDIDYIMLATHNADSIRLGLGLNRKNKYNSGENNRNLIFANLMGMNENSIKKIRKEINYQNNINQATYIPYGPYETMLPYLSRRLYENIDQIKYSLL